MTEIKARFLVQAKEAEQTADVAPTAALKAAWLKIAKNYRALADLTD